MANKQSNPSITKPRRSSKHKATLIVQNSQESLFDKNGLVPFNPLTDAIPNVPEHGRHRVGDMVFELQPPPKDLNSALKLTMGGMVHLHNSKNLRTYPRPMVPGSMTLDSWSCDIGSCEKCSVTFRHRLDDGVIYATYSRPDDHLSLSLPHMGMWQTCGLTWLWADAGCCPRNIQNPTPWLGRTCGCP